MENKTDSPGNRWICECHMSLESRAMRPGSSGHFLSRFVTKLWSDSSGEAQTVTTRDTSTANAELLILQSYDTHIKIGDWF